MRLTRIWYDDPGIRWGRVVATAALLSFVVGLWIALARGLWAPPELVRVVLPVARPASAAAPASRAAVAPPSAALVRSPTRNGSEVCGLGTLPLVAAGPEAALADLDRRVAELRERWLAAMQASGDERVRAAGWLLALQSGAAGAADAGGVQRERLATLAAETRDPLVLAYGLQVCRNDTGRAGHCAQLTPSAWARLEPDNAAAWLAVGADPRSDAAARADALQRAARGTRVDSHAATLQTLARALQPPGASELDRLLMAREVASASAGWHTVAALASLCDAAALRETNRRTDCAALADLLVERAPTVYDLRQAGELGERLGWPAERLAAVRSEADTLDRLQTERFESGEPLACAALPAHNAFFADVGRLGEVGALRQARQRAAR